MKIAQITMSNINNYGSILQTYAFQTAVEKLGHECVTIDYRPQAKRTTLKQKLLYWRRNRSFEQFRHEEIHSTAPYASYEALRDDPPQADVYVTGSDQMFNPYHTSVDPAYFFDFLPQELRRKAKKISYASSFAVEVLPEKYRERYVKGLADYDALSLREQSGVDLAERLTGKKADLCCDPTLLLDRADWAGFAKKAARRIRKPYILCYNLAYMVNPYPAANEIEARVQKELGLPIIFLNGQKADYKKPNAKVIKNATPYEFVDLFFNASFIMTSSFHGTVFALHSHRPFLSYYTQDRSVDTRIYDLLAKCDALDHGVAIGSGMFGKELTEYDFKSTIDLSLKRCSGASLSWLKETF